MAKQMEDFDANLAGEEGKTEETKTFYSAYVVCKLIYCSYTNFNIATSAI